MLKLLKKLFQQQETTRPALEADEALSDTQILQEYFSPSEEAKETLREFLRLISYHLGVHESERLTDCVMSCLQPGQTNDEALLDGLVDERGQQHGKWLLIHLDFRATDELEWQANEVLQAHGIKELWHLSKTNEMSPPQALGEFSIWVQNYGLNLLHLQAGDTDWCAFVVQESDSFQVLQLAEKAGIKVQKNREFLLENS